MFKELQARQDSEYEPVAFKIPTRHRYNKTMVDPLNRIPSGFATTKMNIVQNTGPQAEILRHEHIRQSSLKSDIFSR